MELMDILQYDPKTIGTFRYETLGQAPNQVNTVSGTFQRHIVNNGKDGVFHVITPALPHTFDYDEEVELSGDAFFFEDTSWNGRDVSPARNIFATNLKRVGGNN